jgi:MarR family transcriptional regulator, transcriptional regulator for hemolysin
LRDATGYQVETLPFEIAETAHALRKAFDRRAVGMGVTRAQWKVLFRLERQPGLRQIELADILDIEPITLSRIVDRLEGAALVERVADPADRRAWRLHVTACAQPLIAKLRAVADEMISEAFAGIDPKDIEITRSVLGRVRENASRTAPLNRASNQ